jgi:hypothetical protein
LSKLISVVIIKKIKTKSIMESIEVRKVIELNDLKNLKIIFAKFIFVIKDYLEITIEQKKFDEMYSKLILTSITSEKLEILVNLNYPS